MKLKRSRFVSIAISATSVKVALIKSSGSVERLVIRNIDKGSPDSALQSALTGLPVKGADILCVIPGEVATTKNLEIPSVDHEEIESILALQASRHTPFNKDEILTSYIKLGNPRSNFTRVLMIVVKRDTVKDKLAIIKRAGLNISTVMFVPEGVARFYAAALKVKKNDLPLAIVDVGLQNTNFMIESQSTIVMSRNIPIGIQQFGTDTEASNFLVKEIKASMDTYEQESVDRKPGRFILTSKHVALSGLETHIAAIMPGARCEIVPYQNLVKSGKEVKEVLAKSFSDDSALDVIAPAVVAAKCQAELVPQDIKDQRAIVEKGRATYIAGVLITLLLLSVGGAVMSKLYYKDTFLKRNLIAKYASQKQEVKDIETLMRKTKILREYMQTRDIALESIRELYRLTPPEIYFNNISLDEADGSVSIQGIADDMSNVFSFVPALEASALFEGVKTKSTSTKKDREKTVAAFEIVMQLSNPDGRTKAKPVSEASASPAKTEKAK